MFLFKQWKLRGLTDRESLECPPLALSLGQRILYSVFWEYTLIRMFFIFCPDPNTRQQTIRNETPVNIVFCAHTCKHVIITI